MMRSVPLKSIKDWPLVSETFQKMSYSSWYISLSKRDELAFDVSRHRERS